MIFEQSNLLGLVAMENGVGPTFDHPTHQVRGINADNEVWCGGTQPPSLISVDRLNSSMHIDVFPEGTDTHSKELNVAPDTSKDVEVEEGLTWAYNLDAYTISRAAKRCVREALGLDPDYVTYHAKSLKMLEEIARSRDNTASK